MSFPPDGAIFLSSDSNLSIILSTTQFEFLLPSSPSSREISSVGSEDCEDLESLTKPGALSTRTRTGFDLHKGVTAWIIDSSKSSAFSDDEKQPVT